MLVLSVEKHVEEMQPFLPNHNGFQFAAIFTQIGVFGDDPPTFGKGLPILLRFLTQTR